jgi:hypothetical protein
MNVEIKMLFSQFIGVLQDKGVIEQKNLQLQADPAHCRRLVHRSCWFCIGKLFDTILYKGQRR